MRPTRARLLIVATLLVTACGPGAADQPPTRAPSLPSPAPASPVTSVLPGSTSNTDPQASVDAALSAAAEHLGMSPADLHVDQVDARQWGDSSLGCPKPGIMYSQIVTPGFLVVISGPGKQLEYHTDARGQVVLCQER